MDITLGHNQFIGVSHTSEAKSKQLDLQFSSPEKIMEVVEGAYEIGIRSMIVETHPRMFEFLKYYHASDTIDMKITLQMPNVQSYVRAIGSKGLDGIIKDTIRESRPDILLKGTMRSIKNVMAKRYMRLGATGLEFVASAYMKYGIDRVLVHNVLTDFLLALNMNDALVSIKENFEKDYCVNVGFITLNLPMFLDNFTEISKPFDIMTPVNPVGFDMNPSISVVEDRIQNTRHNIIAMNVLGGGSVPIKNATDYLKSFGRMRECVVGSSKISHLQEAYEYIVGKREDRSRLKDEASPAPSSKPGAENAHPLY